MHKFEVQEAFGGTASGFGPSNPGVDLVFNPRNATQHGGKYLLTVTLASESEITAHIGKLIAELQELETKALTALAVYKKRARAS